MPRILANSSRVIAQTRKRVAAGAPPLLLMLALAWAVPAWAQQAAPPPRYDPRQTEKSIENLEAGQDRAKPAVRLPSVPKTDVRASTKPLFKLRAVSVEGASVIASDAIAETYTSFLGKTVSQADLVAIAGSITEQYRTSGYSLSRAVILPQDIKDGRIRVKVIEGFIAEIVLKGDDVDRFGIRPVLERVIGERPSQLKTLERQLLLANNIPGVRVTDTALEEIGRASGKFRLIVWVKTWRIFAALGVDNQGADAVGPYEAFATAGFNSYFLQGDNLSLSASSTPFALREFAFGRLSYDTPVGTDGARVGFNALYSNVAPGDVRQQVDNHSITETFEAKASVVPLETRKSSLWLTGIFGFSDNSERDNSGMIYKDHLRYVSLTADYKLQDNFAGWNYLSVTARQGLTILGASSKDDDFLSRAGASGNFSLLNFSFTRLQQFSDVWSIKASVNGQWAGGPLLISQQFYLGDAAYGPGFYSGDSGIYGYAEMRFDKSVSNDILKGYQLYGFFDKGAVWSFNNNGQVLSIASVGAGIRFFLADQWQAGLGFAVPVHQGTTANDVNSVRAIFSLSKSFQLCPQRAQMRCL
ncbi:MAG: POTRA domain-containing protein [Pseudolabrys sp.]